MQFGFRLNIQTLCLLSGAALALFVLNDLRSLSANSWPTEVGPTVFQDRVVTKELVIADSQGKTRARLGESDLGAPALSLYDRFGQERSMLRLNQNDVPSLRLFDSTGALRTGVGFALADLSPHLWFFTDTGVATDLIPAIGATNSSGSRYAQYFTDSNGTNIEVYINSNNDSGTTTLQNSTITWQAQAVSGR